MSQSFPHKTKETFRQPNTYQYTSKILYKKINVAYKIVSKIHGKSRRQITISTIAKHLTAPTLSFCNIYIKQAISTLWQHLALVSLPVGTVTIHDGCF